MLTAVLVVTLAVYVVLVIRLGVSWTEHRREAGTFAGLAAEIEALDPDAASERGTVEDGVTWVRLAV